MTDRCCMESIIIGDAKNAKSTATVAVLFAFWFFRTLFG